MRYLAIVVVIVGLAFAAPRLLNTLAQESTPMPGMDMPAGAVGLTSVVLAKIEPAVAPGQELQLVRVEVAPARAPYRRLPALFESCSLPL